MLGADADLDDWRGRSSRWKIRMDAPPERVEDNALSHLLAKKRLANETTGNGCFPVDSLMVIGNADSLVRARRKTGTCRPPGEREEEPAYLPAAYSR